MRWLRTGIGMAAGLVIGSGTAGAAPLQLALVVDGSSSINTMEYDTFKTGLANAIGMIDPAAAIELTVTQFALEAEHVFGPTVIDSTMARDSAVTAVMGMIQPIRMATIDPDGAMGPLPPVPVTIVGGTNYQDAMLFSFDLLTNSPRYAQPGVVQYINMLTDGNPTVDNSIVQLIDDAEMGMINPAIGALASELIANGGNLEAALMDTTVMAALAGFDPEASATDARNFIAGLTGSPPADPIEVLSFEAIGFSAAEFQFLLDLAFPGPGFCVPGAGAPQPPCPMPEEMTQFPVPFLSEGFVFALAGFGTMEIQDAVAAKLTSVEEVALPEPGLGLLLILSLAAFSSHGRRTRASGPLNAIEGAGVVEAGGPNTPAP